jgi:hypothetical protein
VQLVEQVLQCGTRTVRPLCEWLQIRPWAAYSQRLQEAVVDFGAEDCFEKASRRLKRHHGIELSAGTVRKITLRHAEAMRVSQRKTGGVGVVAHEGPEHIVAEIDGTMLPVVSFGKGKGDKRKRRKCEWNEAKLCAARALGEAQIHYGCTMEGAEEAGYIWAHCVKAAGWATNTHVHVVSDGAEWIARQAKAQFGESATRLIDFYHLSEYLAAAGEKLAAPLRKHWLHVQQCRLKKGHADKVLHELRLHEEAAAVPELEAPVRRAMRYMESRMDFFDYPAAIKAGLPTGSGLIEGSHRHVLQKRLKISGAWWARPNAAAMSGLCVLRENGHWDNYWRFAA